MNIGDVVIPRNLTWDETQRGVVKAHLVCGSGSYTHAICVDTDPFILVSEHGDMRWSATIDPARYVSLCQAHPDIVKTAMARYNRDIMNGQIK